MPNLETVRSAVEQVAENLSERSLPVHLDWVARDMVDHPEDYDAWDGPNWDFPSLRERLCLGIWHLPCHPTERPNWAIGLPNKLLAAWRRGWYLHLSDAQQWLEDIAHDRRTGGTRWRDWMNDYVRWRARSLTTSEYQLLSDPSADPMLVAMLFARQRISPQPVTAA